jgi:CHAD domain-containing protein
VRIAVKKLRYALELDAEAAGTGASDELKILKRGQTTLGRMHDLQVLIDRVRRVQNTLTASDAVTTRDLDTLLIALDRSCRRLHARYVRDRERLLEISRRLAARVPPQSKVQKIVKLNGVRRAG